MHLTLCLTHDCTLRCTYCYAGRKRKQSMPWEVAQAAIELGLAETQARGDKYFDLGFFGGEPLMEWPLLQRAQAYAEERCAALGQQMRSTITTNLTLLTAERLDYFVERKFLVGLSVDGNAAMHNACRVLANGQGSHELVARSLALAESRAGQLNAQLICVVDRPNFRHLGDSVRWLMDACSFRLGLNANYSADWQEDELPLLEEQMCLAAGHIIDNYRAGKPRGINEIASKIYSHINPPEFACHQCQYAQGEFAVAASGNIYPCSRLVGDDDRSDIRFGNVLHGGLDRAKQNYLIYRRGNRTFECLACQLRARCTNSCGCMNDAGSGRSDRVSPFACWWERLNIRLADEIAETLYAEGNASFKEQFYAGLNAEMLDSPIHL